MKADDKINKIYDEIWTLGQKRKVTYLEWGAILFMLKANLYKNVIGQDLKYEISLKDLKIEK